MEQLKQNGFWVVLGAVVVAALGFWYMKVHQANAQADQQQSALDSKIGQLEKMVPSAKGEPYTQQADAYINQLKSKLQKMQSEWRQFKVDRETDFQKPRKEGGKEVVEEGQVVTVADPAPKDPTLFRSWKQRQAMLRDRVLESAGVLLPEGWELKGDSDPTRAEDKDDQPQVIERLYISRVLWEELAKLEVEIPDEGTRKVDRLLKMAWVDELLNQGSNDAGQPYNGRVFTLEFAAHAAVVQKFLVAMTEVEQFHVFPQHLQVKQIGSSINRIGGGELRNTYDREAPVHVQFVGLIPEFDFDKSLEAPKPATRGRPGRRRR